MCALVVEGSVRKGRIAPPHRRSVSVIDTATNTLASKVVGIGPFPLAIAISPDGSRTYIVHN